MEGKVFYATFKIVATNDMGKFGPDFKFDALDLIEPDYNNAVNGTRLVSVDATIRDDGLAATDEAECSVPNIIYTGRNRKGGAQ